MLILNFGHPLTNEQLAQVTQLLGKTPRVLRIPSHCDRRLPLNLFVQRLVDDAGLTLKEWQTTPFLINPPPLAPLAAALIAELHGRCGHFVSIVNIRPIAEAVPPRYEVAEVVNLQELRDIARSRRRG